MPRSQPSSEFEKKFAAFPASQLDVTNQDDLELLLSNIRGRLLALETIRQWEKNPDNYSSGVTNSIFSLMERKFAPPDERLKSVIARERQIPAVFTAARQNLKNPPHIYTEIALQQIPDISASFKTMFPPLSLTPPIQPSKQTSPNPTPPSSPRCKTTRSG